MANAIKVAYWVNGLGEECSSRVLAEFEAAGQEWLVVWDWRRAAPINMERNDFDVVRMETPVQPIDPFDN